MEFWVTMYKCYRYLPVFYWPLLILYLLMLKCSRHETWWTLATIPIV
jgi:hypothetical protein